MRIMHDEDPSRDKAAPFDLAGQLASGVLDEPIDDAEFRVHSEIIERAVDADQSGVALVLLEGMAKFGLRFVSSLDTVLNESINLGLVTRDDRSQLLEAAQRVAVEWVEGADLLGWISEAERRELFARSYPRAGHVEDGIVLAKTVDTIDASNVNTTLLGHSYVGDVRSVISDIAILIRHNHPPDERPELEPVESDSRGRYWRFKE